MKKYISLMVVLGLALVLGGDVVRAEEAAVEAGATAEVTAYPVKPLPVKARLEAIKVKADARAEAVKAKVDARAEAVKERVETRAENVKARVEARTEAVKAKVELRAENLAERKTKNEARIEKMKTEKKAKLDEAKKKRVETAARNSVRVLTAALTRVQELALRVEARIAKAEANGVVATDARAKLAEGKTLWDAAKVKVDALGADLAAALASETPITTFETFRTHAGEAKEGIKAAHAKVVEAVASLKAVVPVPVVTPAATVETSASVEVAQ